MKFKRFYTQVSVVIRISLDEEIDMPSGITDEELITEAVQEQVDEALADVLPKQWLDDVEMDVVCIK